MKWFPVGLYWWNHVSNSYFIPSAESFYMPASAGGGGQNNFRFYTDKVTVLLD